MNIQLVRKVVLLVLFYGSVTVFGMELDRVENILYLPEEVFVDHIVKDQVLRQNLWYKIVILERVCSQWYNLLWSNKKILSIRQDAAMYNKCLKEEAKYGLLAEDIQPSLFDIHFNFEYLELAIKQKNQKIFTKLLQNEDCSFTPVLVRWLVSTKRSLIVRDWCDRNKKLPSTFSPIELIIRFNKKLLTKNFFLHETSRNGKSIFAIDLIRLLSVHDYDIPNPQGERPLCLALQKASSEHKCDSKILCPTCDNFVSIAHFLIIGGANPLLSSVIGKDENGQAIKKNAIELVQEPCFDKFPELKKEVLEAAKKNK